MANARLRTLLVEREIPAPPERVWALVADVTRMGEWSPEATGATWRGGADGPALGARFRGSNAAGRHRWSSDCVVTACEPGREFAFQVSLGPLPVSCWSYRFEPTERGCRVVERWEDRRGWVLSNFSHLATGSKDRVARNQETMTQTLANLAAAV